MPKAEAGVSALRTDLLSLRREGSVDERRSLG